MGHFFPFLLRWETNNSSVLVRVKVYRVNLNIIFHCFLTCKSICAPIQWSLKCKHFRAISNGFRYSRVRNKRWNEKYVNFTGENCTAIHFVREKTVFYFSSPKLPGSTWSKNTLYYFYFERLELIDNFEHHLCHLFLISSFSFFTNKVNNRYIYLKFQTLCYRVINNNGNCYQ